MAVPCDTRLNNAEQSSADRVFRGCAIQNKAETKYS